MYLSYLLEEQPLKPALNLTVHCCGREFSNKRKYNQWLQKRLNERKLQIQGCTFQEVKALDAILEDNAKKRCMTKEEKVDTSKALDASLVDTESSGTKSKEQDTSSRSGNDAHANDADIRPIYDKDPMAEEREVASVKPHHMIASSNSRISSKNMPRFSSNDMVYNHYLDEAKKKIQERSRNSEPRLAFCDYHNMIAILEKYEHNQDFYQIVDFVMASHIRYALTFNPTVHVSHIRQFWSTTRIETTKERTKILTTIDGTLTEPHHTPTHEATPSPEHELSSLLLPPVTTKSLPIVIPSDNPPLRQYTRRTRIAQSSVLLPVEDEPTSPLGDDSQAQELEITNLKARVKLLEDKEGGGIAQSGDNAPIKGRSLDEGEEAAERVSDDTEAMATVLTSMDATGILTIRGVQVVPTAAKVATATISIPTGSGVVSTASPTIPTAALIFTTATESTSYTRRKGKETMVEYKTPKKKKIARDAKIARIHAEEELHMMIDGLDMNNETVGKYLQEYHQFATELPIERRIELISDLVKYQDHYVKVLKYQTQQRKPLSRKQQKEFYMLVLKTHAGWKARHFKEMTLEEIKEKFDPVWKQFQDFIPIEEVLKEKLKEMMELILVEEVYMEALQVKHTIIEWEVHTEGQRSYWKIIRLGEWKLYDTCGVHHVISKDQEMFMLVEKDYPLRKGLAIGMISYKIQVENYSQMANDLILKIYKIASSPRQQGIPTGSDKFPLPEQLPTANEDKFPLLIQSDATAEELCTAAEVKE
nr:hypothetical protein [Tanacetum cinerariifolium]